MGYLTYSLIQDGYKTVGLDISQTAVNNAIDNFGNYYICADLLEFSIQNPEKFDIVILTEVIEHINKPIDFMKAILLLLKSSGYTIITTPNKSFYPKDIIWESDLPPVHLWWFGEESLKYIADLLNAKISFINFKIFYNKHYHAIDLKKVQKKICRTQFLINTMSW